MDLASKLKTAGVKPPGREREAPLWDGPEDPGDMGGCTQSMLNRFLMCPERFYLHVIEGYRTYDGFNARTAYGDMWHICEEGFSREKNHKDKTIWLRIFPPLQTHCKELCKLYPMQQMEIDKWFNVCMVQFPIYCDYWKRNDDVTSRTPIYQEEIFHVPVTLPSGRVVYIRGKFDAVDCISTPKPGVWLQENKTQGNPNETKLRAQLRFDMQTCFYLIALEELQHGACEDAPNHILANPILGVRYNVIRRPLSGGKGSIVQHKPTKKNPQGETRANYFQRLSGIIKESPKDFFMRFKVEVKSEEINRFRRQCLYPLLERLCDWYTHVVKCREEGTDRFESTNGLHWRYPYGAYSVLAEGGSTDLDEMLDTGSTVGLTRVDRLFNELTHEAIL